MSTSNDGTASNISRRSMWRSVGITAAIFTAIVGVMAIVFGLVVDDEGLWTGHTSHRCGEYCENSHQCDHELEDRPTIQQPVNTWTNMMYILVGLWPIIAIRVDLSTIVFLLANTYCGIGSFMFHASITKFWMIIDVAGMYTAMTTLVGHGIHAVTGLSWRWIVIPIVALGVLTPFFKDDMGSIGLGSTNMFYIIVPLIIFLVCIILGVRIYQLWWKQQHDRTKKWVATGKLVLWGVLPGVLFGLAYLFRMMDENKTWCDPESLVQGHGAWHCLTAVANLMVWLFFDSNRLKRGIEVDNTDAEKEIVSDHERTQEFESDSSEDLKTESKDQEFEA